MVARGSILGFLLQAPHLQSRIYSAAAVFPWQLVICAGLELDWKELGRLPDRASQLNCESHLCFFIPLDFYHVIWWTLSVLHGVRLLQMETGSQLGCHPKVSSSWGWRMLFPLLPIPLYRTTVRKGLPVSIISWGFHMHKRESGNICPLVFWLWIALPCSNCLCAIGIKSCFRNGEVCLLQGCGREHKTLSHGGGRTVRATQITFGNLSSKWHLKSLCTTCLSTLFCQVCSGHRAPFIWLCEGRQRTTGERFCLGCQDVL